MTSKELIAKLNDYFGMKAEFANQEMDEVRLVYRSPKGIALFGIDIYSPIGEINPQFSSYSNNWKIASMTIYVDITQIIHLSNKQ
jgi:hypothetical protein